MKLKKNLTMATLLAITGTPLLGITNNTHASQTYPDNIKYERQVNGKYVATYNNGKGPAAAYGFSPKNAPALLNKSQADAWNSGHPYGTSNQANNTQSTARIGSLSNPYQQNFRSGVTTRSITVNGFDPNTFEANMIKPNTYTIPAGAKVSIRLHYQMQPDGYEIQYNGNWYYIADNNTDWFTTNASTSNQAQQPAKKSLPQTSELTSNLPLMMASILSLSGIGLAALSLLNKRNQQKGLAHNIIPVITGANGSNDTNIMSETNSLFKEILMDHLK